MAELQFYEAKPGLIEKVAVPSYQVGVWTGSLYKILRVLYVEPWARSRASVFNLGAVVAGGTSGPIQLLALQCSESPPEMLQLRYYPLDDIEVTMNRGRSDTRFKSKNITTTVDRMTKQIDPCLHTTEFVVLTTDEPFAIGANPTNYALSQARISFFGFRYILELTGRDFATAKEALEKMGPVIFVNAGGMG